MGLTGGGARTRTHLTESTPVASWKWGDEEEFKPLQCVPEMEKYG